jgi:hypothetical protein
MCQKLSMVEIIQEITRQVIYKAIKWKIPVEKKEIPSKNGRYFLSAEEPLLKMEDGLPYHGSQIPL